MNYELSSAYIETSDGQRLPITPGAIAVDYRQPQRELGEALAFNLPALSFMVELHVTRRQAQAWRKLAGLPSGRRARRRAHRQRLKRR